jgi:hypothetical protein
MDKQKVAEAASIAAENGDKRIFLNSFGTSTHHVYWESAKDALRVSLHISFLLVVHFPLSVKSLSDLHELYSFNPIRQFSI